MKKKIFIAVITIGIILSLFVGCKDDLIETLEKVQAYVEISVNLPDALTPGNYKFKTYDFNLKWYQTNNTSQVTEKEFDYEEIKDKVIVYKFNPGEYAFELSSYDGNDIKAFGKEITSIKPGQRVQLKIPMTYYVYGEGNGFTVEDGVITLTGEDLLFETSDEIKIPNGYKLVIEDGTSITVDNGKTLTFEGIVEAYGDLTVLGAGELIFDKLVHKDGELHLMNSGKITANDIEAAKLTNTGTSTITADTIEIAELILNGTLTVNGDLTTEEISGSGKVKVTGEVKVDDLLIDSGATLDINSGSLEVTGNVALDGNLELGANGWNSVNFGPQGSITLAEDTADLKLNGQSKWYTLNGAKAKYYKADDKVQLEFIKGSGNHTVTPAKVGAATTETITRVGDGVIFDVNSKKGLKLGSGELILEDGSTTITSDNWWTTDTTFDVENGAIVTNVGAKVFDKNNKPWLVGTDDIQVEWKLTGSAQMRFEKIGGTGTTTVKSTGTSNGAQLDIAAWQDHKLGHNLEIKNNAKVLINMNYFIADGNEGGKIKVEEGGVLEVGNDVILKTAYVNQLTIGGEVIINDGSTLDLFDSWFTWENDNSGLAILKSGGTLREKEKIYFGPEDVDSNNAKNIYFETSNVDLITRSAGTTGNNVTIKEYTIKPKNEGESGEFRVYNSQNNGIKLLSHSITSENGVTFLINDNLTLDKSDDNQANSSKITIKHGAKMDTNEKNLTIKSNREIEVQSGGELIITGGTIVTIEEQGKLIMRDGSKLNGDIVIGEIIYTKTEPFPN